jgi:hypothetical protein
MPNVEKISVALPSEKMEEMEVEELRRLWNTTLFKKTADRVRKGRPGPPPRSLSRAMLAP